MTFRKAFDYSEADFNLLVKLYDELCSPSGGWRTAEMLRYKMANVPAKCKEQFDFICHQGSVVGFGGSGYEQWAFDESRLHSELVIPADDKYLDTASQYLGYQIERARKLRAEVLHGWCLQGSDWHEALYAQHGFAVSLRESIFTLDLDDFPPARIEQQANPLEPNPLEKRGYRVSRLDDLQKSTPNWQQKLFALWNSIEHDVPSDVKFNVEYEQWQADVFRPWYKAEDSYVVLDKEHWVALTAYVRSAEPHEEIYTDLTGVLPEYRRQGICKAMKLHALSELKQKGFKKVWTGNEVNNPMLQINIELGFTQAGQEFGCQLKL